MNTDTSKLFELALNLPGDEREALATALLATLHDPVVQSAVDDAWRTEIRRRAEQIDTGAVRPIAWDETRLTIFAP